MILKSNPDIEQRGIISNGVNLYFTLPNPARIAASSISSHQNTALQLGLRGLVFFGLLPLEET